MTRIDPEVLDYVALRINANGTDADGTFKSIPYEVVVRMPYLKVMIEMMGEREITKCEFAHGLISLQRVVGPETGTT